MTMGDFLSLTDQVTGLLRKGMSEGLWRGTLPGRDRLAKELGVSHKTIEHAMRRLAKEGMLVSQGAGKRRRIVLPDASVDFSHIRVRLLAYEAKDRYLVLPVELLENLNQAGFATAFATKSLWDLGMDAKRVENFVNTTPADAWIVMSGSREVLEWFSRQPTHAYALFGVKSGIPIAGVGVRKDIEPLIQRLRGLGHRRIVMLMGEEHVRPEPSITAQRFLDLLQSGGIDANSYNLPAWGRKPEELHRCLRSLFAHTAPTAILCEEAHVFHAVRDHLARRGIVAPRDISLVCMDSDLSFSWCDPQVSHFTWNPTSIVRQVVRWARNVARRRQDQRQAVCLAKFVEGGTIGPTRM